MNDLWHDMLLVCKAVGTASSAVAAAIAPSSHDAARVRRAAGTAVPRHYKCILLLLSFQQASVLVNGVVMSYLKEISEGKIAHTRM